MNADEIVFDDVQYREPRRLRRPDRDPSLACITYGLPGPEDLPIFIDRRPADAIERHALSDTTVELGGILLGWECIDEQTGQPFVWIHESIEARHFENSQASFTYTHDSWEAITRERDEHFPDLDIVGWYHTHPDYGIFLSGQDLFSHQHYFSQPLQVALVVDPVRQQRGYFQWRDGRMDAVGGFTVVGPRAERPALARFVHELENFPNDAGTGPAPTAAGPGLTLSPRLEAELMAMLKRPPQVAVVGGSSPQAAALFSLLGLVLGVLGVVAALWLSNLAQMLQDQNAAIQAMQATLKEQQETLASTRRDAKEQALDSLLAKVRVGEPPQRFVEAYTDAVSRLREAEARLNDLTTEKQALVELSNRLRAEAQEFDTRLADLRHQVEELTDQQKLRAADVEALKASLAEKDQLIKDSQSGRLARRYNLAWYTAAGALGGCVLLGLTVFWALGRSQMTEEDLPPNPQGPSVPIT